MYPAEVIATVMMWELDSYMCSSSVDFPEEEGMSEETRNAVTDPSEEGVDAVIQLAADEGWEALKEELGRPKARIEMVKRFNAAEVARNV